MKCKKAREILNSLLDGEHHPKAREAQDHMHLCEACRQWHASMEQVLRLAEASRDDLPEVDIASAVMARLPERHPASVARREGRRFPRRLLIWVGAAWCTGVMALITAGLGMSHWLTGESGVRALVGAYGFADSAGSSFESLLSNSGVLITAAQSILSALVLAAASLSSLIIGLAMLDGAILLILMLIWRRRRAVIAVFSVLA